MYRRGIVEINLSNIIYNLQQIRKYISKKTRIMAVVKANAYGHGIIQVATTLISSGVDRLAVAIIEEALQLRNNGIEVPILILGYSDKQNVQDIVKNNITPTVFTYELAQEISKQSVEQNKQTNIHIKIDTGMRRIGLEPNETSIELIEKISKLPNITIEGIFTHFSCADKQYSEESFTKTQINLFNNFCNQLERYNIYIPIKHLSNSAGIIQVNDSKNFDFVRPGILLYGLTPFSNESNTYLDISNFKQVLSFKSNIIHIKEIDEGIGIGYGHTYTTKSKSKIATVPIGYGDGYPRMLSNKGFVIINNNFARIVGNICMDQFMIDVTHLDNVKVGDEVVLIGNQNEKRITVEEIAKNCGTINYEIVCGIGKRVDKIYV